MQAHCMQAKSGADNPHGIISPALTNSGMHVFIGRGRVVWLSAHAWKACFLQGNAGSNPALSAKTLLVKERF